jgi:large conductance mechanosensitive channel
MADNAKKADKAKKGSKKVAKRVTNKVSVAAQSNLEGFIEFIRKQGIVGLAIGFVMGLQAKAMVDQFTASFINPLLGLLFNSSQPLSDKTVYIQINSRSATFGWGAFVYSIINFLIIAGVIYYTFKWLRLDKLDKKKS